MTTSLRPLSCFPCDHRRLVRCVSCKLGMWTEQSRGRMAKIAKKTKRYPSDLTDEEWEAIAPLMPSRTPGPATGGRVPRGDNAVRYLVVQAAAGACCGHRAWRTVTAGSRVGAAVLSDT